jgi:hypothetical protein
MRPRTFGELIHELESEPGEAALVLRGDDGTCLLVRASDPRRAQLLESALRDGLSPVGVIRRDGRAGTSRVFCEYADDSSIGDLLRALVG